MIPFFLPYVLFTLFHSQIPYVLAGIYLFKINNRNTRTRCEICSKLTIKIPVSIVCIVNFEHPIAGWGCTANLEHSYQIFLWIIYRPFSFYKVSTTPSKALEDFFVDSSSWRTALNNEVKWIGFWQMFPFYISWKHQKNDFQGVQNGNIGHKWTN